MALLTERALSYEEWKKEHTSGTIPQVQRYLFKETHGRDIDGEIDLMMREKYEEYLRGF